MKKIPPQYFFTSILGALLLILNSCGNSSISSSADAFSSDNRENRKINIPVEFGFAPNEDAEFFNDRVIISPCTISDANRNCVLDSSKIAISKEFISELESNSYSLLIRIDGFPVVGQLSTQSGILTSESASDSRTVFYNELDSKLLTYFYDGNFKTSQIVTLTFIVKYLGNLPDGVTERDAYLSSLSQVYRQASMTFNLVNAVDNNDPNIIPEEFDLTTNSIANNINNSIANKVENFTFDEILIDIDTCLPNGYEFAFQVNSTEYKASCPSPKVIMKQKDVSAIVSSGLKGVSIEVGYREESIRFIPSVSVSAAVIAKKMSGDIRDQLLVAISEPIAENTTLTTECRFEKSDVILGSVRVEDITCSGSSASIPLNNSQLTSLASQIDNFSGMNLQTIIKDGDGDEIATSFDILSNLERSGFNLTTLLSPFNSSSLSFSEIQNGLTLSGSCLLAQQEATLELYMNNSSVASKSYAVLCSKSKTYSLTISSIDFKELGSGALSAKATLLGGLIQQSASTTLSLDLLPPSGISPSTNTSHDSNLFTSSWVSPADSITSFEVKTCEQNTCSCTNLGALSSFASASVFLPQASTSYFVCVRSVDNEGNKSPWASSSGTVSF